LNPHSKAELLREQHLEEKGERTMKRIALGSMAIGLMALAAIVSPNPRNAAAQTRNQSSKFQITESFTFPNECTAEMMDVSDTTTVTCHDQQRADGTFAEKCEIRQDVTATGQTTGIVWHGTATFKDEFLASDPCNSSFSNRGKVNLISAGNSVNAVITFDDLVRMDNCVLTANQHLVSFDCRGKQ
jgi:hypothetical protein